MKKEFSKYLTNIEMRFSERHLLTIDKKVLSLLCIVIILFSILVTFKIHGSSSMIWDQIVPDQSSEQREGILWGTPKGVRSDEWVVSTPFALSQSQQNPRFPIHNDNLGGGNSPLLMNLPVAHITAIFKPQNWGYFFLGAERGLSYHWNFKTFGLFLGFFFLLLLITNNKFWLSIAGSLWLLSSSYIQWWFSTSLPEMIMSISVVFLAGMYLILSKKKVNIFISLILLAVFGLNFILFLYPPFQVILVYLYAFLGIGFLVKKFKKELFLENLFFKFLCAISVIFVSMSVLYIFYIDAKETISLLMQTVYPGTRRSVGMGVPLTRYFSGYYSGMLREGHFPVSFINASEASNFILLFPVVMLGMAVRYFKRRKIELMQIMMVGYISLVTFWMVYGFPSWLANATLFSFSPTERCYLGVGLGSIILTILFVAESDVYIRSKKQTVLYGGIIFSALLSYGLYLTSHTDHYFRYRYIIIVTGAFTVVSLLLLAKKRILFSIAIIFIVLIPAIFVNPVSSGLAPIFSKELSMEIGKQNMESPKQKWAVYGSRLIPPFFVANGADVIDGVKYVPDFKTIDVLDPEKKFNTVYNRYAHTTLSQPVDNQEVNFKLIYADLYTIYISPCSPKLKQVGVTRLAFSQEELPNEASLKCLVPLAKNPVNSVYLYEYR